MSAQPSSDRCTYVHPRDGWQCIGEARHRGVCRKYREPEIGDLFGNVKVLKLHRLNAGGLPGFRSDLRAEVQCQTCGATTIAYVHNLRYKPPTCTKRGGCNR